MILSGISSKAFAQQSIFDEKLPDIEKVKISLKTVEDIVVKKDLTGMDMLHVYFAEKVIGRCVWGVSPKIADSTSILESQIFGFLSDTLLMNKCIAYILSNKSHFKVVEDGYKGEDNFWEPNDYWFKQASRKYPNSIETKNIEFDLDFNKFIRKYDIDVDARGKTAEQYYKEDLEMGGDFSGIDIKDLIPACEDTRKEFSNGREELLRKYKNASFANKLKDIDTTTIIVNLKSAE